MQVCTKTSAGTDVGDAPLQMLLARTQTSAEKLRKTSAAIILLITYNVNACTNFLNRILIYMTQADACAKERDVRYLCKRN